MTTDARPGRFSEPLPREIPDAVELIRIRVPLLEPFVTAHGVEHDRDLILVHAMAADGAEGWGECSTLSRPGYGHEHTAAAWSVLAERLVPAILGGRASDVTGANPMAGSGLEVACVDLALRRVERSLTVEFDPAVERLPAGVVVGVPASIDDLLSVVERRVAEGYAQVKLKVTPDWFLEPLRAVRAVWPDLAIAADANGSLARWYDEAGPTGVAAVERLGLDYLEQPLPPERLGDHAAIIGAGTTAIALDESIPDRASFDVVRRAGFIESVIVNVKPARLGGLDATRALLHDIAEVGCSAFVGGMLESGVGRATALAGATSPVCNRVGDLGPSDRYFARDIITEPFAMVEGTVAVPTGAGIGVEADRDAVEDFAVDRVIIRRP